MHTDTWQDMKMHTEEIDQHDTEPESRNGDTYITKHTGNLIQNTILILSGIQAQYNGNEKTKQHAGSHEDHGCGKPLQHLCQDRTVIHQGISEIPVKDPSQPQKVLLIERLCKSQAFSQILDIFFTHIWFHISQNRISGRCFCQCKTENRDNKQCQNTLYQSVYDLLQNVPPLFSPKTGNRLAQKTRQPLSVSGIHPL